MGRLYLDGSILSNTPFNLPEIHVPEDQLKALTAFIHRTEVPYREWWARELHDGSVDALVALLSAHLSSLRFLHLGHAFTPQSGLTGMVLRSLICETGAYKLGKGDFQHFEYLQNLTFAHCESRDEACDWKVKNTADILPFFYLPNLQFVSASIDNPDKWLWPAPLTHAPSPLKLKSFDLTDIRERYLGEILAVTKNLETLSWKWYYDNSAADDFAVTQTLDLDQVGA
jgi:hypothetical protein